jgi:16S rRNA (uracil1498-N3)-methyltransferase
MNLILFESAEEAAALPSADPRAVHILRVLRCGIGDAFDAGLINGPRGKGVVLSIDADALTFRLDLAAPPPPLDPITLVLGLPRPQIARRVLQEGATLGFSAMHFVATHKGDPGYGKSTLWTSGEWRRHLVNGAQQAYCTRIPEVSSGAPLADVLASLPQGSCRLALDNYEATQPLSGAAISGPAVLALGPERGWSARERDLLRAQGFELVHLGWRVLRVDTACTAAGTLVKARLGLLDSSRIP